MKKIEFKKIEKKEPLLIRSNREQLIADIVSQCNIIGVEERKKLAALIAILTNKNGWPDHMLHKLLKWKQDPKIKKYVALVKWAIKQDKIWR